MRRVIGIDLAITAESRACVADATGDVVCERRFRIRRNELEALFQAATDGMNEKDELVVVMEPTSSMWIAPTAFFRSKGARVHLVPPEQSADLRRYYTSTSRPIASTPSSWHACHCFTPTVCTKLNCRQGP